MSSPPSDLEGRLAALEKKVTVVEKKVNRLSLNPVRSTVSKWSASLRNSKKKATETSEQDSVDSDDSASIEEQPEEGERVYKSLLQFMKEDANSKKGLFEAPLSEKVREVTFQRSKHQARKNKVDEIRTFNGIDAMKKMVDKLADAAIWVRQFQLELEGVGKGLLTYTAKEDVEAQKTLARELVRLLQKLLQPASVSSKRHSLIQ